MFFFHQQVLLISLILFNDTSQLSGYHMGYNMGYSLHYLQITFLQWPLSSITYTSMLRAGFKSAQNMVCQVRLCSILRHIAVYVIFKTENKKQNTNSLDLLVHCFYKICISVFVSASSILLKMIKVFVIALDVQLNIIIFSQLQ